MNTPSDQLLSALRIGLHHTQRAAGMTRAAYRRALEDGMHGTADWHHQAWQDTLAAIKVIQAAIDGNSAGSSQTTTTA